MARRLTYAFRVWSPHGHFDRMEGGLVTRFIRHWRLPDGDVWERPDDDYWTVESIDRSVSAFADGCKKHWKGHWQLVPALDWDHDAGKYHYTLR